MKSFDPAAGCVKEDAGWHHRPMAYMTCKTLHEGCSFASGLNEKCLERWKHPLRKEEYGDVC